VHVKAVGQPSARKQQGVCVDGEMQPGCVDLFIGEVVTSRYFYRKAVLSTLDQLDRPRHTQENLQKTQQTRPSSPKVFFFFFVFFTQIWQLFLPGMGRQEPLTQPGFMVSS
jgi:hypothetical protein